MISFPNCKINLGLHVLEKRNDGYHNLETIFFPLKLNDVLEIIQKKTPGIGFSSSGLPVDGNPEENICVKAYHILKKDFPQLPSVEMHLHKTIPMGAGLGGGSADGAFILKLLDQKFDLNITTEKLFDYSLQLGSDCPFFIRNEPGFATGRGEIIKPVNIDLSAYKFFLVHPGIHISTSWAFENIRPAFPEISIKEIIRLPVETWREKLINDFEEPVFRRYPEIKVIKDRLYDSGAIYASMTGSGSALYGIFSKEKDIKLSFPSNYFTKELLC